MKKYKVVLLGICLMLNISPVFANYADIFIEHDAKNLTCGFRRSGGPDAYYAKLSWGATIPSGYKHSGGGGTLSGTSCSTSWGGTSGYLSCNPTVYGSSVNVRGTISVNWISATIDYKNPGSYTQYFSDDIQLSSNYDTTPPDCGTITINGRSNGWFKAGSYTAKMSAKEGGVGFGGCWKNKEFSSGISSSGGTQSVTIGAADEFGNHRNCSQSFNFDGTAPGCSATYVNNGWTNQSVYVQGHCSDSQSGCNGTPSGTAIAEDQTVTLTCRDNVGNERNASVQVTNIDKTPPSCGSVSSTRPSGGGWTRESIPVTVGCWDAKSGCTQGSTTQMISGGWGNIGIADNATNTSGCDVGYDFWDGTAPSVKIQLDEAHDINSIEAQSIDDQVTVSIGSADNQ